MLERLGESKWQVLYRYVNDFGYLVERDYRVLRETRSGKWVIDPFKGTEHFVLNNAKKRLAYPTKEEALTNFIKRTERHIMFAEGNLKRANEALGRARAKQKGG